MDFGSHFNPTPFFFRGNGDGTVNRRSLVGCAYWRDTPAQNDKKVYLQEIPNVEHYDLLSSATVINYILDQLLGVKNYPFAWEYKKPSKSMKIRLF